MPDLKERYLKEHTRDICPGCGFWVPWYRDKRGKTVRGCQIGEIPDRGQCDSRKSRRGRESKYGR